MNESNDLRPLVQAISFNVRKHMSASVTYLRNTSAYLEYVVQEKASGALTTPAHIFMRYTYCAPTTTYAANNGQICKRWPYG